MVLDLKLDLMNLMTAIGELTHKAREMKLPDLRRFISDLKLERGEVEPYLHFTENRYARNLVHKTADFECLVLCCRPEQASQFRSNVTRICPGNTGTGFSWATI